MESCTWGILQHCKHKIHPNESDFGVLSHKFFLTAMTGSSCLCAWLFCSTAHWDYGRQVLAAADAGKCCFLGVCSLSHQVLLRVGLDDKIYKIQHLPLFLSSLSLACECISPCCKDFRWHQARTGGVSQPQITSSDLFISFSPAACLLPFLVFFYSLILLFQLFFAKIFYQSISKLFVTVLQRTLCTLPFPFFFPLSYFFLIFSLKQHSLLKLMCTSSYKSCLHTCTICDGAPAPFVPQVGGRQFSPAGHSHPENPGNISNSQCLTSVM